MVITLVSCGKLKGRFPVPARDLYISPLFKSARAWAERYSDDWYVTSFRNGLLPPSKIVAPYNVNHAALKDEDSRNFAVKIFDALSAMRLNTGGTLVVMLSSRIYQTHLVPKLQNAGYGVWCPLNGLRMGERLQWLVTDHDAEINERCRHYRGK